MNATRGCPCTDERATYASLQGRQCTLPSGEPGVHLIAGGACFPHSYGSSQCRQHDLVHDPRCRVDQAAGGTLIPAYCFRPWCFVDPDVCKRDSDEAVYRSSYFPSGSGVDLFYSYSTCNSSAADWLEVHNDIVGKKEGALGGITITASVPSYQVPIMYKRDPVTGEPYNTLGDEYYNNSIPYEGIYPDFVQSIVDISKGDIKAVEYTYKSRASSALHSSSSYTAVVQDIENGLVDMGVAPFWVTSQRLKMVAFTIPMLYDKTFLVVPQSSETLGDQILKVLSPFSYGAWLSVLLIIIATALLAVWFTDPYEQMTSRQRSRRLANRNNPKYRNKTAYARLAVDQFLEKGTFFFSAGVEQERGSSLPNKVLLFGFAFFILIAVSAYVANLAAFLTRSLTTGVTTMEAAVKEGVVLCAHPAVEAELKVAWPQGNFYYHQEGNEVLGMIADYEAGRCQALAIGFEDNTVDTTIRDKLCENGLRFTDSLVTETPMAFPISPKLASGMSFWIMDADKNHGISIKKMNEEYLTEVNEAQSCPLRLSEQEGEASDYAKITVENFALPLILYATCAGLAIILQFVHLYYKSKGERHSLVGRNSQLNLRTDRPGLNGQYFHRRRKSDDSKPDSFEEHAGEALPQCNGTNNAGDGVQSSAEIDTTSKSLFVGDMKDL